MKKKISNYLTPDLVTFLENDTQEGVLKSLVNLLHEKGKLLDRDAFLQAIIEREKIISTGIGMGVAIPHAKLSNYDDFFIAIAILKQGVDWKALDDILVRIVFMIGGPDDKQTEYLQILSGITGAIKEESIRKKLLSTKSPKVICDQFKEI